MLQQSMQTPWVTGHDDDYFLVVSLQSFYFFDEHGAGWLPAIHCANKSVMKFNVSHVGRCSVQSLHRLGRLGDMRDDSAEILFQSFLQGALVNSYGMGRDVHSLLLSIQHFLCRPRHCTPSKVPYTMILQRLTWCVTCLNDASFCLLTVQVWELDKVLGEYWA